MSVCPTDRPSTYPTPIVILYSYCRLRSAATPEFASRRRGRIAVIHGSTDIRRVRASREASPSLGLPRSPLIYQHNKRISPARPSVCQNDRDGSARAGGAWFAVFRVPLHNCNRHTPLFATIGLSRGRFLYALKPSSVLWHRRSTGSSTASQHPHASICTTSRPLLAPRACRLTASRSSRGRPTAFRGKCRSRWRCPATVRHRGRGSWTPGPRQCVRTHGHRRGPAWTRPLTVDWHCQAYTLSAPHPSSNLSPSRTPSHPLKDLYPEYVHTMREGESDGRLYIPVYTASESLIATRHFILAAVYHHPHRRTPRRPCKLQDTIGINFGRLAAHVSPVHASRGPSRN